jgi:hypothetical protein
VGPLLEIRSSSDVHFVQESFLKNEFNTVFGHLRADVTAMRSQCMRAAYCHDHKVWHDLHDLEKALAYAEERMSDLSRRIVTSEGR